MTCSSIDDLHIFDGKVAIGDVIGEGISVNALAQRMLCNNRGTEEAKSNGLNFMFGNVKGKSFAQ